MHWQPEQLDGCSRRRRRAYCTEEELNPRSSLLFFPLPSILPSFLPFLSFSPGFLEHSQRQWAGAANLGGTAKSETMANNASRAQFLAGLSPSLARRELHGRRSSCQQDLALPPSSRPPNNGRSLNHLGDSPRGSASRRK